MNKNETETVNEKIGRLIGNDKFANIGLDELQKDINIMAAAFSSGNDKLLMKALASVYGDIEAVMVGKSLNETLFIGRNKRLSLILKRLERTGGFGLHDTNNDLFSMANVPL